MITLYILGFLGLALSTVLLTEYVGSSSTAQPSDSFETAIFAGGCFWCIESAFQGEKGIIDSVSGYTGGSAETATYEQVGTGTTDHYEAVKVTYDPAVISYNKLVDIFFNYIDPTDDKGQFADKGSQYKTALFVHSDEQHKVAEARIATLSSSGKYDKSIVTEILDEFPFYPAEEYHQDFFLKKTGQYERYYEGSGRKDYVESQKEKDLSGLTAQQIAITQNGVTELPFQNAYWNNHADGIYVDVVSGKPLFSSTDKYDSGTGWPSFTKPIKPNDLLLIADDSQGMERTEVKSAANSHLGHVFDDGPGPTGERFCINSGALRFVPLTDLEKEGYGEFLYLFEE